MVTTYLRRLCVAFFLVASVMLPNCYANIIYGASNVTVSGIDASTSMGRIAAYHHYKGEGMSPSSASKAADSLHNYSKNLNNQQKIPFETKVKSTYHPPSVAKAAKSGLKKAISVGKIAKSSVYTYVAALGLEYAIKKAG